MKKILETDDLYSIPFPNNYREELFPTEFFGDI